MPPLLNTNPSRSQSLITPVSSHIGCDESHPDTHQDQASGDDMPSPWRLGRPRRTLVPRRVQGVLHRPMVAGHPAPIPGWLASRAIRVACTPVTAIRPPIQTRWLLRQSPNPGWPVAVETHAKQRVRSNGKPSFSDENKRGQTTFSLRAAEYERAMHDLTFGFACPPSRCQPHTPFCICTVQTAFWQPEWRDASGAALITSRTLCVFRQPGRLGLFDS